VDGAPVTVRVFFPSLDGSVFAAPILDGCAQFPVILFAHGQCHQAGTEHYKRWYQLPVQLARSGYVVVVPDLPSMATDPSTEDHPALGAMVSTLVWLRGEWEHRDVLLPAAAPLATAIAGHSRGALLAARFARVVDTQPGLLSLDAFASLSGVWGEWHGSRLPIRDLTVPMLFVSGDFVVDPFTDFSEELWAALDPPKHRAVFAEGGHWDYLAAAGPPPTGTGRPPCDDRDTPGPCR
jgi:alpha-beta hydrolase superfamily lysophospholipase